MLQSHIIEIDGVFVGAAVRLDRGYRFVPTDFRVEELEATIWPTLLDLQRVARRVYRGARPFSAARPGDAAAGTASNR